MRSLTILAAATASAGVVQGALVAYYPLSTDWYDHSGNGLHLSAVGSGNVYFQTVGGKRGVQFSSSALRTVSTSLLPSGKGDRTVCAWAIAPSVGGYWGGYLVEWGTDSLTQASALQTNFLGTGGPRDGVHTEISSWCVGVVCWLVLTSTADCIFEYALVLCRYV